MRSNPIIAVSRKRFKNADTLCEQDLLALKNKTHNRNGQRYASNQGKYFHNYDSSNGYKIFDGFTLNLGILKFM